MLKIAAQLLGFPTYIPPNSRARGLELLRGANYASGAAGIRDETGNNLVCMHSHMLKILLRKHILLYMLFLCFGYLL